MCQRVKHTRDTNCRTEKLFPQFKYFYSKLFGLPRPQTDWLGKHSTFSILLSTFQLFEKKHISILRTYLFHITYLKIGKRRITAENTRYNMLCSRSPLPPTHYVLMYAQIYDVFRCFHDGHRKICIMSRNSESFRQFFSTVCSKWAVNERWGRMEGRN